jgi:hypothetical protein
MQDPRLSTTVAIALATLAAAGGAAGAATLQECAVNFSICYGTCASTHPEIDVSGRGLCQAGCVATRASCEASASDRPTTAPARDGKTGPRMPSRGILETGPALTTQSPSGTKKPPGGSGATPSPPAASPGRLQ